MIPEPELLNLVDSYVSADADARRQIAAAVSPECRAELLARCAEVDAISAVLSPSASSRILRPGMPFGDFELIHEIGRGGMGVVWRAHQRSLARDVALKLVSQNSDEDGFADRFEDEARTLSRLDHPGIVKVHGAGREHGWSYYAMDLVEGQNLREHLAHPRLAPQGSRSVEGVALVMADLAGALAYAHARGVVHRDVKPANVAITKEGRPRLLDFGLARKAGAPRRTQTGAFIGTPAYLSPEVLNGELAPRETQDLWALGVILFELTFDRLPFDGDDTHELLRNIRIGSPRFDVALPSPAWRPLVRMTRSMLARDPRDRYPTAARIEADLRRIIAGEPIDGVSVTWSARVGRHLQRRWSLYAAAVVCAMGLLAGMWLQTRTESDERRIQLAIAIAAQHVDRNPRFALQILDSQVPRDRDSARLRNLALRGLSRLYHAEAPRDAIDWAVLSGGSALVQGAGSVELVRPADGLRRVIRSTRGVFAPSGSSLSSDGSMVVLAWDLSEFERRASWWATGPNSVTPCPAELSVKKTWVRGASAYLAANDGLYEWSAPDVKPLRVLEADLRRPPTFRLSEDSSTFVAQDLLSERTQIWRRLPGGQFGAVQERVGSRVLELSPDGRHLAMVTRSRTEMTLVDLEHGTIVRCAHDRPIDALDWSEDGRSVVTGGQGGLVRRWSVDGTLESVHWGHDAAITSVLAGPGGVVVAGASDGTVRMWIAGVRGTGVVMRRHNGAVRRLAFAGNLVVSFGADGSLRLWDPRRTRRASAPKPRITRRLHRAAVSSHDGRRFVIPTDVGAAFVEREASEFWRDLASSMEDRRSGPVGFVRASWPLIANDSGSRVLRCFEDRLELWDPDGNARVATFEGDTSACTLQFLPGSDRVALSGRELTIWNPADGSERKVERPAGVASRVIFDPDAARIGFFRQDGALLVRDFEGGGHRREYRLDGGKPIDLATLLAHERVLASDLDGNLTLWDSGGSVVARVAGGDARLRTLSVSASERWLATTGDDGMARVVDLATAEEWMAVESEFGGFLNAIVDENDSVLWTWSQDGAVRCWSLNPLQTVRSLALEPIEPHQYARLLGK